MGPFARETAESAPRFTFASCRRWPDREMAQHRDDQADRTISPARWTAGGSGEDASGPGSRHGPRPRRLLPGSRPGEGRAPRRDRLDSQSFGRIGRSPPRGQRARGSSDAGMVPARLAQGPGQRSGRNLGTPYRRVRPLLGARQLRRGVRQAAGVAGRLSLDASRPTYVLGWSGSFTQASTGQTEAHCGSSWKPTHSVHFFGSMT